MSTISAYQPVHDFPALVTLWQTALGETWPLTAPSLSNALACPVPHQQGAHFVAREGGQVVGFVATQLNASATPGHPPAGHIMALCVTPAWQGKGTGARLLDTALNHLRQAGAKRVQLGGKYPRIWPGVPANLPGALRFFSARGWEFNPQIQYDLVRSLKDYSLPEDIGARMAKEGISIEPASADDAPAVIDLNANEFAGWVDTYRYVAGVGDHADLLIARDPRKTAYGGIVGSLVMFGPQSNPARADVFWKALLGDNVGGMGEVGVAKSERGRGIGVALVAYGSEILKARGVGNTFIGWTSLADFYGKLGYAVWQEYRVGYRGL